MADDPGRFTSATFGVEIVSIVGRQNGGWRVTFDVPFEDRAGVFALSDAPGLLLEATVAKVKHEPDA